jgi:hypothetical protein
LVQLNTTNRAKHTVPKRASHTQKKCPSTFISRGHPFKKEMNIFLMIIAGETHIKNDLKIWKKWEKPTKLCI